MADRTCLLAVLHLQKELLKMDVNVCQIKSLTAESYIQIQQIKESILKLKANLYTNQNVWNNELDNPLQLKQNLEIVTAQLFHPQVLSKVRKTVKKWKKKKESRMRRNKLKQLMAENNSLTLSKRHSAIDEWRNSIIKKSLEEKQKAQMKLEADTILEEVRKKIAESRRICQRMAALEKLRLAKKENWLKKGLFTSPESDERFEKGLESIRKTFEERLEIYNVEERALQVMLQSEKDVENERIQSKKEEERLKLWERKEQMVLNCLFSESTEKFIGDNYFSYYIPNNIGILYNNSREPLIVQFIEPQTTYKVGGLRVSPTPTLAFTVVVQGRMSWDQFLVTPQDPTHNNSSSIPFGWVIPDKPSSQTWHMALDEI